MKCLRFLLFTLLFTAVLISTRAFAQTITGPPCLDSAPPDDGSNGNQCAVDVIGIGNFHATPFTDANCTNGCPD